MNTFHNVDTKGRVGHPGPLPLKDRARRGADPWHGLCLTVYPTETWERKARRWTTSRTPASARPLERQFFAAAFEVELDAQGRIGHPAKLRKYAGLNGEAMIVGARDRFKIWSSERWQSYLDELAAEDLSDLALPF